MKRKDEEAKKEAPVGGGTPKESTEKGREGNQEGAKKTDESMVENSGSASDKRQRGNEAKRVGGKGGGWLIRTAERTKTAAKQDVDNAKKEIADTKQALKDTFDGTAAKRDIANAAESIQGIKDRKGLVEEAFATADKPTVEDRKRVADTEQRRKEPSVVGSMEDYYDEDKPSDGVQKGDKEKYTADEPRFVNINELNSNAAETPNAPVAQGETTAPEQAAPQTPAQAPEQTTDTTSAVTPPVNNPLPNPAPNTDLADKVNTGYTDLAGKSNANSAWVSTAKETQNKQGTKQTSSQTTEQGVLREAAKQQYDKLEQQRASLQNQYADLQAKYNIEPKGDIEKRLYEQKVKDIKAKHPDMDDKRVERKAQRRAKKEAEREHEYRKEALYRELDPDYESDKAYKREQNIKTIIAAIGDFGRMAGQAVTAANSGTILPFRSLTDGAIEDKRISDQQRKQLKQIYAKMAQGRLDSIKEQMQALEKQQLDIIKSEASYDKVKNTRGAENNQTLSINETDKLGKGTTPGSTSSDRVLENAAAKQDLNNRNFEIPSTIAGGEPYTGLYYSQVVDIYNRLFEAANKYRKDRVGKYDAEDKDLKWLSLAELLRRYNGPNDETSKTELINAISAILIPMSERANKGDSGAQDVVDVYKNLADTATRKGSTGGNSGGGGATVANVFGSSNGGGNKNLNNF